ncbi:iron ABC transporter permease, partial [Thioclava sp. BHET1]
MKGWTVVILTLLIAAWAALALGIRPLGPADIWTALTAPDPGNPAYVTLRYLRLPRMFAGLMAGGALGMAGMLMQSLTRNPLADPGVLGVNAGAAFAVTLGALLLGRADGGLLAALAFPGAAGAAIAVFA